MTRGLSKSNVHGYRYEGVARSYARQANALSWVLESFPSSLQWVRGIDLCTDELGIPLWVTLPAVRRVLLAGRRAQVRLQRDEGRALPPPRITAHAGEDFVHLLTGLRLIHQSIARLGMSSGDRIGHGLALGVDVETWCQRRGRVPIQAETRFFDLLWARLELSRGPLDFPPQRLDDELARLGRLLFSGSGSLLDLGDFIEFLYAERSLELIGYPHRLSSSPPAFPSSLVREYLTSTGLFEAGQQVQWIQVEEELELIQCLQEHVRRFVSREGIAVEVNPSSNLLVGDLGSLTEHSVWQLRSPNPKSNDPEELPPLCVVVGTDDPINVASNLPLEYQRAYDAMITGGLGSERAREWIDRVRQRGLEYRFTLPYERRPTAT